MEIPLSADVRCGGSTCGTSIAIVLNPVSDQVTHFVVKERQSPHRERLVPIREVAETTPEEIRLRCSPDELSNMEPFVQTEFIRTKVPYYGTDAVIYRWGFVAPEVDTKTVAIKHERIPAGELAVRRGARVECTDGQVGKVDEFLADTDSGHITHLVLREGHLWGRKDVSIPVSAIDRIDEGVVHLSLSKKEVEALPAIRIHR
jgi:uncharacterized protein YrrD